MSEMLQLIAGAATKDGAIENGQGLGFPANGINNSGGWNVYVPATLRIADPLPLRFTFIDPGVAGTAIFTVAYNAATSTEIVLSGSTTMSVTTTGVASTLCSEDVIITDWVNINTVFLVVALSRDSSVLGDVLAATLYFFNGRTIS